MKLVFHGQVDSYSEADDDYSGDTVRIGGRDILAAVDDAFKRGQKVTVAIAEGSFVGDLQYDLGSRGYSELTPGDASELKAGPNNLKRTLDRYEDKVITMWISDEAIDFGADGVDQNER